ncbi:flagellar hook-associated protein FlgL [Ideonella sp.]|jgi:flagellar hook-associated protein 3 FlgL|uniref:flagellar hook-associated protein FlgL n=1 Tax=Ideonella sp. TaxID=1929293 RepID=UPI0037C0E2A3
MIRVSTANAFASSVLSLQKRQQDLSEANERLTNGKRVMHASDDPTAAARAERARSLMQRTDATQRALDASRNSMTLTESALADGGELLQQARELLASGGNASFTDAERRDVANQITAIRNQLLGVANRSDGTGGYIFAGQGASQPPFIDRPGGVGYVGTGGEVRVASEEPLPLTLDGQQTWLSANTGNGVFVTRPINSGSAWIDSGRVTNPQALTGSTYTIEFTDLAPGQKVYSILRDGVATGVFQAPFDPTKAIEIDGMAVNISGTPASGDAFEMAPSQPNLTVFQALDRVIAELKTPNRGNAAVTQTIQSGLRDIDSVRNHLQSARSMTGEMLTRIDGAEVRVQDLKLFSENTRSAAEDLDMIKAISDFQNKQTGYEAALQTYSTMQRMSLFDYIKT